MAKLLGYKANWNLNTHSGLIHIRLWSGNLGGDSHSTFTASLQPQTPEEMQMLVDLLRNEEPIEYDSSTKELRLGEWEVAGEEES